MADLDQASGTPLLNPLPDGVEGEQCIYPSRQDIDEVMFPKGYDGKSGKEDVERKRPFPAGRILPDTEPEHERIPGMERGKRCNGVGIHLNIESRESGAGCEALKMVDDESLYGRNRTRLGSKPGRCRREDQECSEAEEADSSDRHYSQPKRLVIIMP